MAPCKRRSAASPSRACRASCPCTSRPWARTRPARRTESSLGGGHATPPSSLGRTTLLRVSQAPARLPADARRRRFAVRFLPRDDGVAEDADPLDLALDHVPGLEVERGRILAEAG